MIYHPIYQYIEHTDILSEIVAEKLGDRFIGIETNIDGQFMLLADDVTLAERDELDSIAPPVKKIVKITLLMISPADPYKVPLDLDFVSGLRVKLHRKSILVKGECIREEFYLNYDGTNYSDMVVKEETSYNRNVLGFPVFKDVIITWANEDGSFNPVKKTWRKYYSNLEQITEGKYRRGNLISNLQMPTMGLISMAMIGVPTGSPEVILEGRKFLAYYKDEFETFVSDSNKNILKCLNDSDYPRYITADEWPWIDYVTSYGITIRQYLTSELTI